MLPFEIRMKLYQAYIVPHFNYGAETRHFCSKRASDKLEKINKRALCFVYWDNSSSYEILLQRLQKVYLRLTWPAATSRRLEFWLYVLDL